MTARLTTILTLALLPFAARGEVYVLPSDGSDVIGAVATVEARAEDTLLDIARRHGLGYEDIVLANPDVDVWLPGAGTEVVLPTRYILPPGPRRGLVLNLAEYRMYYFPEPRGNEPPVVMTYPMSIGRMDWATPLGRMRIVSKMENPSWYPPESVRKEHEAEGTPLPRVVPPGPDNPLGKFAMRLTLPSYLIHGTNRPAGVGMRVTHGCIRMYPEDIEYLFSKVAVDTEVRIVNEPVKIGWDGDRLVMEVHRSLDEAPIAVEESAAGMTVVDTGKAASGIVEAVELPSRSQFTAVTAQFVQATSDRPGELDWDLAERLLERADGLPVAVGRTIKNAATSAAFE